MLGTATHLGSKAPAGIAAATPGCTGRVEAERRKSMSKPRLKVGDRVRKKGSNVIDVVESLPGMREYDQYAFDCANLGMILRDNEWDYQADWQLVSGLEPAGRRE